MADGSPRTGIGQLTGDDALSLRAPPHNHEAEIQLLGAILANNRAYERVADFLRQEHFADDRHARIFEACGKLISRGLIASAITLKNYFEQDASLADIGGIRYLGQLAASAVTIINAGDHGRLIHDLYLRRQLIALGEDIVTRAYAHDLETGARDQIEKAETELAALHSQRATAFLTVREVRKQRVDALRKPLPCDSTGFERLDAALGGGLIKGKTYGLCGRKKQCKTLWAGSISAHLNRCEVPHLYIAGEMGPGQIEERSMAAELEVNALSFIDSRSRHYEGFISAAGDIAVNTPNYTLYSDARGLTFDRLKRELRAAVRQHKIRGAILDYLQLVGGKPDKKSKADHLYEVAQWLADFAAIEGVWLLVLAQMNQEGNVRDGEGIRLAVDLALETMRDQGGEGLGLWLRMMDTRYTRWGDIGSEQKPAFLIDEKIGPRIIEQFDGDPRPAPPPWESMPA